MIRRLVIRNLRSKGFDLALGALRDSNFIYLLVAMAVLLVGELLKKKKQETKILKLKPGQILTISNVSRK